MKFKKKPVVIEAILWDATLPTFENIVDMCGEGRTVRWDKDGMFIKTLQGEMRASTNDWIIRGVKGEIYPCKPDIFEATYEAV